MKLNNIQDIDEDYRKLMCQLGKFSIQKNEAMTDYYYNKLNDYINNIIMKRIDENWILSSELLCEMLDLNILSSGKCSKIIQMLVTYYGDAIQIQINKWIKNEQYEKCEIANRIIRAQ